MKTSKFLHLLTLAVATFWCAMAAPTSAGEIRGNCGNNFTLAPTANPNVFTLTHPGVAQLSIMGNCTYDGTGFATFTGDHTKPILLTGNWRFTSSDGSTTLNVEAEGIGTPD